MQLKYRGINYEYEPKFVETEDGAVGGKYRRLDWRFRNLKNPPILQPRFNLTYRGVKYNLPGTVPSQRIPAEPVGATSTEAKARSLMLQQTRDMKKRQQTLLQRVAGEIGLKAPVAEYWNHIQGKVHPTFRGTYQRSGAAMS